MRAQEISDVFLEKAPVTASSQRPRRCYGALVTFYRVPTEFLLAFLSEISTCVLLKYERTHCPPSEQLFLKKVATQQLKLN